MIGHQDERVERKLLDINRFLVVCQQQKKKKNEKKKEERTTFILCAFICYKWTCSVNCFQQLYNVRHLFHLVENLMNA